MSDIIKSILAWPLIVQGALGSGLFWLVLLIGQKATALSGRVISQRSIGNQINHLKNQRDKYIGLKAHRNKNIQAANYIATGFIYKSLRSLFTGLIWLSLGLIFGSVIPVLGMVGFIGCIYHMFNGLALVQEVDKSISPAEKIRQIDEQLEKLEPKKQNQSAASEAAD